MFRRVMTMSAMTALAASTLLADFSYREKSTVTGGALAGMMKVAAVFSKQAREPMETSVSVKGDRMTHRSPTHSRSGQRATVNAGRIATANNSKKT